MSNDVTIAIIGSATTMVVALGGWAFAYLMQRNPNKLSSQARRIDRLSDEVRARIALEKAACDWLGEATGRSADSIKLELRTQTQDRTGLRPRMSSSDVGT